VLDVGECESEKERLELLNQNLSFKQNEARKKNDLTMEMFYYNMILTNHKMIGEYQKKIQAAGDYSSLSASLYASAKQSVSTLLDKSTESVDNYVKTSTPFKAGSYGDTSWMDGITAAYKASQMNQQYRYLQKLSGENEGSVYVSNDNKYLFYNGEKWTITGPDDYAATADVPAEPVFKNTTTSTIVPFSESQFNIFYFMANFGASGDYTSAQPSDGVPMEINKAGVTQGVGWAADIFSVAADSMEKYDFAFKFEVDGNGEKRAYILGRDDRLAGGYSSVVGKDIVEGHSVAANAYEYFSGDKVLDIPFADWPYDIQWDLDPARNAPDAYTIQYYFDDKGKMKLFFPRYTEDKIMISVAFSDTKDIDITDWFFNIRDDASKDVGSIIAKNMK
jgi:hypothetical protein